MIRQLCPHCQAIVELPEDSPGKDVPCPQCNNIIVVPASYEPAVDPNVVLVSSSVSQNRSLNVSSSEIPEPPPGFVPIPAPATTRIPPHGVELPHLPGVDRGDAATGASLPSTGDYSQHCAIELSARCLAWTSVLALSLILLLSFFSWIGAFPGGYRVYTQMPWQAMIGSLTTHSYFDETLAEETELKKHLRGNWALLLPYLLFLLAGTGLAWAWRLVNPDVMAHWPRPWSGLKTFWPALPTLLTGLAVAMLFLLLLQCWVGFGLEMAVQARIAEEVAAVQEQEKTTRKLPRPFLVGEKTGRYSVGTTTALNLVVVLQIITVVAMVGWLCLSRREGKPAPRFLAQW